LPCDASERWLHGYRVLFVTVLLPFCTWHFFRADDAPPEVAAALDAAVPQREILFDPYLCYVCAKK